MAMDLLDFLAKGLGGDFASRLSGLMGENAQATQNALDAALPLLLVGAARKASMPAGASDLLGLINRHGTDPAQLASLGKLLSGNSLGSLTTAGRSILSGLFGDRATALGAPLSNLAGVRPEAATALLSTLAPLVFGLLRGHASREGLGATALSSLLLGQRDALARRVPEELASSLGWGAPSTWFGPAARAHAARVAPQPPERSWLPWIIAILVGIGLLFLVTRCGRQPAVVAGKVPVPGASNSVAALPGTVTLNFEAGSDAPAADAAARLGAIVAYAKAHPGTRVTVSGYDDSSGRNRSLAIRNVLVGSGVSEDNVDMGQPLDAQRVEVSVKR